MQPEYPFKPPAIMMLTPSGRFATGTRLCLSMSDFHPVRLSTYSTALLRMALLSSFGSKDDSHVTVLFTVAAARCWSSDQHHIVFRWFGR